MYINPQLAQIIENRHSDCVWRYFSIHTMQYIKLRPIISDYSKVRVVYELDNHGVQVAMGPSRSITVFELVWVRVGIRSELT